MRFFATEKARRKRQRVHELRGRDHESTGHERKERALVDQCIEAARADLPLRRLTGDGRQIIGEHRLHVGRIERRIAPEPVADGLVEEYRNLVIRLLSDINRFRLGERAKVHIETGVDACACDHRRQTVARA